MSNAPTNGKAEHSNGKAPGNGAIKTVEANAVVVDSNGKKLGGVTGKGFLPGQSGNPTGKNAKHQAQFGEKLRDWLLQKEWVKDVNTGKRIRGGKQPRLLTIINRLAEQKPEVLLHYAYGKPVEMHQIEAAEGTDVEFIVRVHGKELP